MPCNGDYLNATAQETDSRKFCRMLCYVLESLTLDAPSWVVKAKDEYYGNAQKVNEAVVMLCETIRSLDAEQLSRIVYDGRNPSAREVADFWDAHEAADKRREKTEKERVERERETDEAAFERLKEKLGR